MLLLAKYFDVDEKMMLTLWLADKVLATVKGEDEVNIASLGTAKAQLMDVNR